MDSRYRGVYVGFAANRLSNPQTPSRLVWNVLQWLFSLATLAETILAFLPMPAINGLASNALSAPRLQSGETHRGHSFMFSLLCTCFTTLTH